MAEADISGDKAGEPCDNMVGIVVGSVLGTLALCVVITGFIIYFMIRRRNQLELKYLASAINAGDRQFSMNSNVEPGVHNGGYVGDNTDSSDVIMMMDTKRNGNGTNERASNGRRREVQSIYKNLDCVEVSLIGKEVSGLGFDVQGNPRDGISISNIHDRGAAKDSNLMKVGDKVISLTISFDNMVYEDALTLLSYASPYPITMVLGKKQKQKTKENGTLNKKVQKVEQDCDSMLSSAGRSPDLSYSQSENSSGIKDDISSLRGDDDSFQEFQYDEDTDDDTKIRAPSHLPQNIKSIVESKKCAKQAVEAVEDHSKHQVLSQKSLESSNSLQLSLGAQNALQLILNKHSADITVEDS